MDERSINTITDNSLGKKHRKKCFLPHVGIIFGILSSIFFSFNAVFAKMVSIHPVQIALSRCFLQYVVLLPRLAWPNTFSNIIGPRNVRAYLWLHGIVGSLSGMLFYLSVESLSVGNAATLSFLDVVLVPIFGRIFFKETLTVMDAAFALVSFSGVVLIAKPPFLFPYVSSKESESAIGVLYGVLSALLASFSYLSIRKIGKQVHYCVTVFYYSFIGAVLNSIVLPIIGKFQYPCQWEIIFLVCMMAAGLLGQVTLTLALQRERAGTVAVLLTLQIIVVYIAQVVILNDIPSTLSLIGSGLIFVISICVGLRKLVNEWKKGRISKEED